MSKKPTDPKTDKQAETKKPAEIDKEDLDQAQGGGITVMLRRLANPHLDTDQGGSS